jgi:hypothetical protein
MKSTTPLKQTWVQHLPHWDNLRILMQYDIYKPTFTSPPPRLKKEAKDTTDQLQAPTPGAGRSTLVNDVAAISSFSPWPKRGLVKMK